MAAAGVPTAASRTRATTADAGSPAALDAFGAPYVVKDDGLAAGKGVVVTDDRDAALAHAADAAAAVVIEEYLDGPEVSLFVVSDGDDRGPAAARAGLQAGRRRRRRPQHRRHGRLRAAALGCRRRWSTTIVAEVVRPTSAEMARRGTPVLGLLYAGLALTSTGLRVVEFNGRFGDPGDAGRPRAARHPAGRGAARRRPRGAGHRR